MSRGEVIWLEIGSADRLPVECAVTLDNLHTVPQALLTDSITRLDAERLDAICKALTRATGC